MEGGEDKTDYLDLAQRLVTQIEQGDSGAVDQTVDELTRIRETMLFRELGTLTRELHEALKSFKLDTRLSDIASNDIPDARERLKHVISMTEQSAHRTLTAIETSLPRADEIARKARYLAEEWQRFCRRDLSVDEFRLLSREVGSFLDLAGDHGSALHESLSDALMAQDYQDLTGQIIRRVIGLVQEVEDGLVELVRISGTRMAEDTNASADTSTEDNRLGNGPAVSGRNEGAVSGQDEVDDLLSSLGF